jgi:hypothetical protein
MTSSAFFCQFYSLRNLRLVVDDQLVVTSLILEQIPGLPSDCRRLD